MAFNEDSSASGHDEPWIQWFCGLKGHEMFCEVERSYIEDGFNLYGLRACVSNFSDCLDLILDRIGPDDSDDSHLTQSACTLYGLIHARYIITAHGLDAMYNKYAAKDFGTCPLVQCQLQNVLPVGLKDEMGADTVKLFCPKCQEVYHAPPVRSRASSNNNNSHGGGVDGAAFGTTFPHLFLMTFSNLVPDPLPLETSYIPRVFGFRVHKSARSQHRPALPAATTNAASAPAAAAATEQAAAAEAPAESKGARPAPGRNGGEAGAQQPPNNSANRDFAEEDDESNNNNNAGNHNNNNAPSGVLGEHGGDDNRLQQPQRSKTAIGSAGGSKRPARKDEADGNTGNKASSNNGGGGNNNNGPTFLMENAAKRRRRNNS